MYLFILVTLVIVRVGWHGRMLIFINLLSTLEVAAANAT